MRGYTLVETLLVLTLLAVGVSSLAPTARKLSDLAAVTSTREELVGLLLEARSVALASGGSRIVIVASPPAARIDANDRTTGFRALGEEDGITVDLAGRDSTTLRFDPLGIGRFASQTIVLRRGGATTSVVVSSYGRVRRR